VIRFAKREHILYFNEIFNFGQFHTVIIISTTIYDNEMLLGAVQVCTFINVFLCYTSEAPWDMSLRSSAIYPNNLPQLKTLLTPTRNVLSDSVILRLCFCLNNYN